MASKRSKQGNLRALPPPADPYAVDAPTFQESLPPYMEESPSRGEMGSGDLFKPVFHPGLCRILIERVRECGDLSRAATTMSIPVNIVHGWLRRGAVDDGTPEWPYYKEFLARVEGALGDHESKLVAAVALAAERGDWRAASWLLGKSNPDRWGDEGNKKKSSEKERGSTLTEEDAWWGNNAPLTRNSIASSEHATEVIAVDSKQEKDSA